MRDSSFVPRNGRYPVVLVVGGTSDDVYALLANLDVRGMRAEHWEAGKPWGEFPPSTDFVILCKDKLSEPELEKARTEVRGAQIVVETRANWNNARSALAKRGLLRYWAKPEGEALAGPPEPEPPPEGPPPESPPPPAAPGARAPVMEVVEAVREADARRFRERIAVLAGKLSDELPDDVDEVLITASRLRIEVVVNPRRKGSA